MIFPDGMTGARPLSDKDPAQAELGRRVLSRIKLRTGKSREQLVREVLAADADLCRRVEVETGRKFDATARTGKDGYSRACAE